MTHRPVQVRTHNWFPTKVKVPWHDDAGTQRTWQDSISDPEQFKHNINMQMKAWSDELFRISNRKFALCFKTDWAPDERPLREVTCVKTNPKRQYLVDPSCLRDVVVIDPKATVVVFWIPKGGEDVPPWRKKKGYRSIKAWSDPSSVPGQTDTQCIFFITGREIPVDEDDSIQLRAGFKDEFWHILARALNRVSKSQLPVKHSDQCKKFEQVCVECRKKGSAAPGCKYAYLYGKAATWEMCDALGQKWGWISNWGCGAEAIRGRGLIPGA